MLFRTSWVYASRGHNFVRAILKLAAERMSLRVIADQFGVPTPAALLADVTVLAVGQAASVGAAAEACSGTYHVAPRGQTTWHGISVAAVEAALRCGEQLRISPEQIVPIATADFPLPAPRPANSRLCTSWIEQHLDVIFPEWHSGFPRVVAECLGQLGAKRS